MSRLGHNTLNKAQICTEDFPHWQHCTRSQNFWLANTTVLDQPHGVSGPRKATAIHMKTQDKNKIRVAYIVGGLPFGGVENWLLDLNLKLKQQEKIVPVVINISGTGLLMPQYELNGIKVFCIGNSQNAISSHRIDTVFRLRRLLTEQKIDIIHTFHFSGDYFGRLASLGTGIPTICHVRNIKSERKRKRRIINKLLSWRTTHYLAVSKAVAQTIQHDHNWAKRPVEVLYNAVDPEKLDVCPCDLEKEYGLTGRVFIGVGRLVRQKNFDKLIRAFANIRKENSDCSLLILGDGSLQSELEALAKKLNVNEWVKIPGYVPNKEIPKHLKAAHALVMPSDYEGLPVTHLEALFCGLPAIISEHVPSMEIASESSLICTTDIDDIARKMLLSLNDNTLYEQKKAATKNESRPHTITNYIQKLTSIYSQILESDRK